MVDDDDTSEGEEEQGELMGREGRDRTLGMVAGYRD